MSEIMIAPVQGSTDAAWRYFHHKIYNTSCEYYTPFIRLEKHDLRRRDASDYACDLSRELPTVAQIIFRDYDELAELVDKVAALECRRIDINMGCPFPLQTARGRGAATVARPECVQAVTEVVGRHPEIDFSIKMRLGLREPYEWKDAVDALNNLKLRHITMHPRVAKQQYNGEPNLDVFEEFLTACRHKVIYNGDVTSIQDARAIQERFTDIAGIMVGRGVLGRPSLINEIISGEEMPKEKRLEMMLYFHRCLLQHYQETLTGGEHQVLSKIKVFWEYAESEIGRKARKALLKASSMAKYHTALALLNE